MSTASITPKRAPKGGSWSRSTESVVTVESPLLPTAGSGSQWTVTDVGFWDMKKRDVARAPRAAFHLLLQRVKECPPVYLYHAVEQGVPTSVVLLIANAFGGSRESVMDLIGVSETTFRRKEEANEPLPEVAGHRVMGFLRIVAKLQRLLEESGDPERMAKFDLEAWVKDWMREPLPELGDKTPADMLRNPEGQRAVEDLLERMRGGLPA